MTGGERRRALEQERTERSGRTSRSRGTRPASAPRPSRRGIALGASGATIALLAGIAMAPPAVAEPIDIVTAAASGHAAHQAMTVSAIVASARIDRDDPVASAVAGIIAGQGGAAGERAAGAIVSALALGGAREQIVATALSYLGDPYVLDGSDHSGIDCSGLVMVSYAAVGIPLGHLVHLQDDAGRPISESDAQPGDLVVFDDEEHIAIYLGDGMLIQAPEEGRPVEITTVWQGVPHHFTRLLH
ncbi:C40 family peptidase [Leifsonia sp. 1010]|uniref:C40 family peptidase n=1 Tax=Leifsonia sp. 1010 TaxID=2817769 RepID=UPI0028638AC8|nr:C40 family peptidase [Leifsonia sp. 1010]MDR6610838.1 cell wall-associated NlpC family hydrolase [Leifsonia sp. 1010]